MTHVVVAYWRPRAGQTETIEAILRELGEKIRAEPGNLMFVVNRSTDNPNEFLLYEQYKDEQAFTDHQQTPHLGNTGARACRSLLGGGSVLPFGRDVRRRPDRGARAGLRACNSSHKKDPEGDIMLLSGTEVVVIGGSSGTACDSRPPRRTAPMSFVASRNATREATAGQVYASQRSLTT